MLLKKIYIYNSKIKNIEDRIPDITNLATKTTLNAKINEAKGEIPSTANLATTISLAAVENKIPSVKIEKKTTDHNHDEYTATPEFNKLLSENFAARFKQANVVSETDFDNKLKNLNK